MNPIMFSIGSLQIRWYSFFILLGVILGMFLMKKEAKRFNISSDHVVNLYFYTLIFGIIGARLYYVLFNYEMYKDNLIDILKIWNGGLAIHGGVIAGTIALIIYTQKYNLNKLRIMDMGVVSLIIGQALGRWGNFFNSEAHGAATTFLRLKEKIIIPNFVIKGMNIGGVYYHPTFYYEFLWCLLGFIILLILRRRKNIKVGQITWCYAMWYGLGRFFIESLRTDSLMLGGFRIAQIVSIILFIIGLVGTIINLKKGKYENLYNEVL